MNLATLSPRICQCSYHRRSSAQLCPNAGGRSPVSPFSPYGVLLRHSAGRKAILLFRRCVVPLCGRALGTLSQPAFFKSCVALEFASVLTTSALPRSYARMPGGDRQSRLSHLMVSYCFYLTSASHSTAHPANTQPIATMNFLSPLASLSLNVSRLLSPFSLPIQSTMLFNSLLSVSTLCPPFRFWPVYGRLLLQLYIRFPVLPGNAPKGGCCGRVDCYRFFRRRKYIGGYISRKQRLSDPCPPRKITAICILKLADKGIYRE